MEDEHRFDITALLNIASENHCVTVAMRDTGPNFSMTLESITWAYEEHQAYEAESPRDPLNG